MVNFFLPCWVFLLSQKFEDKVLGLNSLASLDCEGPARYSNVGGWFTHGDLSVEVGVDFFAVVEHRLILVRVRNWMGQVWGEGGRVWPLFGPLRLKIPPIWVMLELVLSVWGCACCFAYLCRCPVQTVLWLRPGSAMPLTSWCWWVFALGCFVRISRCGYWCGRSWKPGMIVGDCNVEPTKILCLAKNTAGLWVDFEKAWALTASRNLWGGLGCHWWLSWDFIVGCPLAAAAVLLDCTSSCCWDSLWLLQVVLSDYSAGSAYFFLTCWIGRRCGHVDRVRLEGEVLACRGFCSVSASAICSKSWDVGFHFGIWCDNLGVVHLVGRLLDGHHGSLPFELVNECDLLLLVDRVIRLGGLGQGRVTKVRVTVMWVWFFDGRVRELKTLSYDSFSGTVGYSRRGVGHCIIHARGNMSGICGRWCYSFTISRTDVTLDSMDCTSPHALVWSAGALPKRCRPVHSVRERAFLRGHVVSGVLGRFKCLHLPSVQMTMCIGLALQVFLSNGWPFWAFRCGVSFFELLILDELWTGKRLSLDMAHPRHLWSGRPVSVSVVPESPGIDIRRSYRFVALMRSLCLFPGGLGRCLVYSLRTNRCWFRHVGW